MRETPTRQLRCDGVTRLEGALIGIGLALSTATQLRLPGSPVGLGEFSLLLGAGLSVTRALSTGQLRLVAGSMLVIQVWAVLVCGLLGGWLVGLVSGRWEAGAGFHDAAAYLFSLLVTVAILLNPHSRERLMIAMRTMTVVAAGGLSALLLGSVINGFGSVLTLEPWSGVRFVGWATNPNQIGLLIGVVPFFAYYYRRTVQNRFQRWRIFATIAASIVVGVATLSDALLVAWLSALSAVVLVWVLGDCQAPFFSRTVLLKVLLLTMLVTSAGLIFYDVIQSGVAERFAAEQGQASVRLLLWEHGVQVFLQSPIVGYGPGPYSWIYDRSYRSEAHNTFIDLAVSAGAIGLGALIVLLLFVLNRALRLRNAPLLGGIVCISVFSVFHFVLRHPVFWVSMVFVPLCASLTAENVPKLRQLGPAAQE